MLDVPFFLLLTTCECFYHYKIYQGLCGRSREAIFCPNQPTSAVGAPSCSPENVGAIEGVVCPARCWRNCFCLRFLFWRTVFLALGLDMKALLLMH